MYLLKMENMFQENNYLLVIIFFIYCIICIGGVMNNQVIEVLSSLNDKLWIIVTILIFILGLYFTIKLRGIQFDFKKMLKEVTKKEKATDGISSFKTLMLSLAGRIGVGSISGVALAIYLGGPGTIFWIWMISLLSATLAYSETYLGIKYREKDEDNVYKGGPAYYIKKKLNLPKLGAIYAAIIIICYGIGFMSIQSNTISKAVIEVVSINPVIIGIILSIITLLIIFGGIKKIANATSKIVPIMSLLYIGLSLYVIIKNISLIPNVFSVIISGAFNLKSFASGFLVTLLTGVQRGIFSNEAGLGTGSIAASSGSNNNPSSQGYIQMLGIYITSFLICTSTAIIILTSNYNSLNIIDPNGIEIATSAFNYHLGSFGNIFLVVSIFLFAFSTILSGYYYGESSLKYFFSKVNKKYINILKILTIIVIFVGSIASSTIVWKFTDVFVAFLAFINIYAMYRLRKEIK